MPIFRKTDAKDSLPHAAWTSACRRLVLSLGALAAPFVNQALAQEVPRLPNAANGALIAPANARIQQAMQEMMIRRAAIQQQAPGALVPAVDAGQSTNGSDEFPYGGNLATNPDVVAILEKAKRYQDEGNYRTAGRFWQAALKQAGDTLYSEDGESYFPLVRRIEAILAALPPEGLEVFRVSADADAAGYLAEGKGSLEKRVEALQKVVDFAFLSSQGDDAVLELATYHLDRYEVFTAETLLQRLLESYPDPKVPLDEVWLKLAVARAIGGDQEGAQVAWKQAEALSTNGTVHSSLLEQVRVLVQQTQTSDLANTSRDGNWTTPLGLGAKLQTASSLPADYLNHPLAPAWMYRQHLREWSIGPRDTHIKGVVQFNPLGRTDFVDSQWNQESDNPERSDNTRLSIEREWQNSQWQSASMPLLVDDKVIFKSQADLSVWSTNLTAEPILRSVGLNRYSPDSLSFQLLNQTAAYQANSPFANRMKFHNLETMQFFGDQLFQTSVLHNGIIYSIEGPRYERDERMPSVVSRSVNIWSAAPTRDRQTMLVAYELQSGKSLWNKPFPTGESLPEFEGACILGPPIGYHEAVVVPVLASGRFYVVALNGKTGDVLWRQTICDSPGLSTSPMTMVQMALSGNDLYMTCGCGVLARLNVSTGQLVWARRYHRSVDDLHDQRQQAAFGLNREWLSKEIQGWRHDLVAVWGTWVLMAASDRDELMAFDRGSGEFAWMAPRQNVLGCSVDQWLGIKDGILYAFGPEGLLAYELAAEGRLYGLPQRLERSITGRGVILDEGVLLPTGHSLQRFDRQSLKMVQEIPVDLPGEAQVGSLLSDGKRLWSAAAGMLTALEPVTGKPPQESSESQSPVPSETSDTDTP